MQARNLVTMLISITSLCSPLATLAQKQSEEGCVVKLTEPRNGDKVGGRAMARGEATIPPGKHLWIFAHLQGLALWWPQCDGPAKVDDHHKWVCSVAYGQNRDQGSDFEVAAVVPGEEGEKEMQQVIKDYQDVAKKGGDYYGVDLPQPMQGCEIVQATVTRK